MTRSITLLAALLVFITSCRKEIVEKTEVTEVVNPSIGIKFSIKSTDWETTDGKKSYSAVMEVPELTNEIYDHGAVLAYIAFGTNYYEALPEVFDGLAYGAIHSTGYVTVDFHALDGSLVDPPAGNTNIKIVLIPTTVAKAKMNIDLKNLKEVEKTFLSGQSYRTLF